MIHFPILLLRDASRTSVEGCLAWASSAFSTGDVKSRIPLKSQSLGKHKLPFSDSMKPVKSKVRKTITESSDAHYLIDDPVFQQMMMVPKDSNLRFDTTSSSIPDAGINDFESILTFDMDDHPTLDLGSSDVVPHHYVPGLIAGLEDCSLLLEITDVG